MFASLNRRKFLERSTVAVVATQLPISAALAGPRRLDDIMQHVDPLVREPDATLPDAQNAFPLLEAAAKPLADFPEVEFEIEDCFSPDKPDADRDRTFGTWLDKHEPAIELVRQAVVRGKLEYPKVSWPDDHVGELPGFRNLSRLLRLRSQRQFARGRHEQAIETTHLMSTAFRMLKDGGGFYVDYLIGYICESSSWELMRQICVKPQADVAAVRTLLEELPSQGPSPDSARRAIRAEYCRFLLPQLVAADTDDVDQTIRSLIDWNEGLEAYWSREDYERRCKQFGSLFAGHPKPYDLIDTIKRTSAQYAGFIRGLDRTWSHSRVQGERKSSAELVAWPAGLTLSALQIFGERSEVTDAQIAVAREKLKRVDNPIGKEIVDSSGLDSLGMHRAFLKEKAGYDGTRLFLAVRIYTLQQGELPPDLDTLVAAEILDGVPIDPFAPQPFQYSRDERAIWSVGPNADVSPIAPSDDLDGERFLWRLAAAKS